MNVLEESLIVQQAYKEHQQEPGDDPVDLLLLKANELGLPRGAIDFKHADAADGQNKGEQDPVKVTK